MQGPQRQQKIAQLVKEQGFVSLQWLVGQLGVSESTARRDLDVLEGEGVVYEGDTEHPLRTGDVVYVKPDEVHQFRNTSDAPMKFLCLIPNSGAGQTGPVAPECGTGD